MKIATINEAIRTLGVSPEVIGRMKLPLEVGLLYRGAVRSWIKFAQGYPRLEVHALETWGLIDSTFSIEIEGPSKNIASILRTLRDSLPFSE